ncbi:MAG: transglutaminase-like domain-containing protein, partial [Acidimicrobiia bacterium]|nr:transglutaminase-like domain-containing protein [Acidimicrobiia bacterium]
EFSGQPIRKDIAEPPVDIDRLAELPSDLDPKINALASELTVHAETPYEQALLIEAFFRDADLFEYSVDIDPGHSANNLADWLFDAESPNYRTGYCEQFATGMAVMSRSLGIPTRVVLGFTPGDINEDGLVVVRQRNAHAWVETWLDGHGWVRFDPTPRTDGVNPSATSDLSFDPAIFALPPDTSLDDLLNAVPNAGAVDPRLDLLDRINDAPFEGPLEGLPDAPAPPTQGAAPWMWITPLLGVLGLAIPMMKLVRRRRRLRRLEQGDITAAWAEIVDRLADLGSSIGPDETPLEVADRATVPLKPLALSYSRVIYGPDGPLPEKVRTDGTASFTASEEALKTQHTASQRAAALWSLRSVRVPEWVRRRR